MFPSMFTELNLGNWIISFFATTEVTPVYVNIQIIIHNQNSEAGIIKYNS